MVAARSRQSVLILGGSGLVGSRFVELTADRFDLQAPPRATLDALDSAALASFLRDGPAEVVVNLAACADVDRAEAERDDAAGAVYKVNAVLPGRLAELCGELGKHLLHVSTDYVFDGCKDASPYLETDTPNPLSWYAQTKYQGEVSALEAGASVARIEMPFSPTGHRKLDFPRLCASRLRTGTEVVGVVDQRITPVFLDDCVEALAVLIEQRAPGVWHVAATDWTTPFDFARAVARNLHLNASLIVEDRFERFASFRPAPRPRDSWLNVSKFEREFGTGVLRSVEEELAAWAARLMRSRSVPSST